MKDLIQNSCTGRDRAIVPAPGECGKASGGFRVGDGVSRVQEGASRSVRSPDSLVHGIVDAGSGSDTEYDLSIPNRPMRSSLVACDMATRRYARFGEKDGRVPALARGVGLLRAPLSLRSCGPAPAARPCASVTQDSQGFLMPAAHERFPDQHGLMVNPDASYLHPASS